MNARLMLVEDDAALARVVGDGLRAEGFEVELVTRGDLVAPALARSRPSCVVLDLRLPGRDGLDVLRDLRSRDADLPVLVLTARADLADRVLGLELGADDYLAKPFEMRELVARVRALLRRARQGVGPAPRHATVGAASFDFAAMSASGTPGTSDLTPHDLLVMQMLCARRGEVLARADILEEVCGLDSDATLRTVDNHVVALRRAIGDDPRRPRWLRTVRGIGYRLEADGG